MPSNVEGALTRLDPIRPIQLLARSLPRKGAEMRRGNEDDTSDFWAVSEDEGLSIDLPGSRRK